MKSISLFGLTAVILLACTDHGSATPFTISGAATTKQSLAAGETGTVTSSGSLIVTGNNVAVTVTGSSTINNDGAIQQTSVLTGGNAGNGRAIRDNTGGLTLIVNNGSAMNSSALIQTADADVIQMKVAGSTVTLNNYGTINSQNSSGGGNQAIDWAGLNTAVGSNTLNNYSPGIITASEADAVRPGLNGHINNDGTIKSSTSTASGSDGVDAQTNSGIAIVNAFSAGGSTGTGLIEGGRHGITGGDTSGGAYTMSVTNNLGGTIQGDDGSGINIDGVNANEVVAIVNHGTITGNGVSADGDGVDVDGLVNITNTGTIRSLNANNNTSEGVTVGGGTILNSGTIRGSISTPGGNTGVGRGITIAGVDKDVNDNPIPVQAPYGATTITNSGLIRGDSDSGIAFTSALAGGFTNTITNQAGGTIEGGGATAAAIQGGADIDNVINSGAITADSSGKAIDLGAGNDSLTILGGSASITGDISGGTGTNTATFNPGASHSFSYSGSLSNFSTVEVQSGSVTLSGASTYTGTTKITGGTLTLVGADRLSAGSTLTLDGGTLELSGIGAANGQTFAALSLDSTSVIDLNSTTSLTFGSIASYTGGAALSILGFDATISPGYAIRFSGDLTADTTFLSVASLLTINGVAPVISYSGGYTNVTPVPEPSTIYLAVALTMLIAWRIRRHLTHRN